MRLQFPNGEHRDVEFDQGELLIGSDSACAVSASAPELRPIHAIIGCDPRGLTLSVLGSDAPCAINGRRVREKAFVRLGDELNLGGLRVRLCEQRTARPRAPAPDRRGSGEGLGVLVYRVVLRVLTGERRGRLLNLNSPVSLTANGAADGPSISIALTDKGVFLQASDAKLDVRVNGVDCVDAVLLHGDQVEWAGHRYLLEAPGLRVSDVDTGEIPIVIGQTGVMSPIQAQAAQSTASPEPIWLRLPVWFVLSVLAAVGAGFAAWLIQALL